MKENRKLLQEVLNEIRQDMTDEEVLNLLSDSKISVSPEKEKEKYTLGQRAADTIAKFAGSWAFIFSFAGVLVLWMVINAILATKAFDPYPFILLNLVLSCVAAIQAPLIMMSQNRQEEKDRNRAENDYKVNLKTEIMIEDLYDNLGTCKHLRGDVSVVLFFIKDYESSWTDNEISDFTEKEMISGLDFLENQAKKYGVDLELNIRQTHSNVFYDGEVIEDINQNGNATINVLYKAAEEQMRFLDNWIERNEKTL